MGHSLVNALGKVQLGKNNAAASLFQSAKMIQRSGKNQLSQDFLGNALGKAPGDVSGSAFHQIPLGDETFCAFYRLICVCKGYIDAFPRLIESVESECVCFGVV